MSSIPLAYIQTEQTPLIVPINNPRIKFPPYLTMLSCIHQVVLCQIIDIILIALVQQADIDIKISLCAAR